VISWRSVAPLGAAVFVLLSVSAPAEAQLAHALASPRPPGPRFTLDVHAGTAFPLAVGLGVRLETPERLLLDAWAGGVPDGYADIAADVATSYGVSREAGALLAATATGAAVVRFGVGVRPIENAGLELLAGYTLFYASPSLPRGLVEAATGQSFAPAGDHVDLDLAVHAIHVEVDYALVLFDHVVVRLGIGMTFAVGASARLGVPDAMRMATPIIGQIEHDLSSAIPGRAILPELRVLAGGRF
jgi:hypothetical protein